MPLKLNSSGGGSVTLDVPATAGTFTATVPANTGTLVTTGSTAAVTPAMLTQPLTLMTAQNSTSGTFIDFTGIPSWARRITVILNGVGTNGTAQLLVRLGTSAGLVTSGYNSFWSVVRNTTVGASETSSAGFGVWNAGASEFKYATMSLVNISSNNWVSSHSGGLNAGLAYTLLGGGSVSLPGTLDRIRILAANGTDAFNAGAINIMYEG